VLDFFHMGASLSMRSFARVGSCVSVFGKSRISSAMSVLDCTKFGSSLSLRSFARHGSSLSLFGEVRMGSAISLLGFANFGSTLSLRGFGRVGSALSVMGITRMGSSLSVLDFVAIGNDLRVSRIKIAEISDLQETAYAKFDENKIELEVDNQRMLSVLKQAVSGQVTGTLHGTWESDATVTTSDRRLKTSIEPLYRTMARRAQASGHAADTMGSELASQQTRSQKEDSTVSWLLRELRPVSFHLKRGPEAKYLKFGFIAQELETVFPNLVRKNENDDTLSIANQDLIAVLTLAVQNLQKQLQEQLQASSEMHRLYKQELSDTNLRMERLERMVLNSAAV